MNFDSDFVKRRRGKARLYLEKVLAPHTDAIASRLASIVSNDEAGAGNRRSAYRLTLRGAPDLFARRTRRGGAMRFLVPDIYFGAEPRPLRELLVTIEARTRGVPLAEPMGAVVEWVAPMIYRGFFLTRALEGMTLWDFLRRDCDSVTRGYVLDQARHAIDTMHHRGLLHADLNLHNLFVTRVGDQFTVVILDLDKARLYSPPLSESLREATLARLSRSARRLDPVGRYLDDYARSRLSIA
jgi:hypothetical protein